MPENVAYEQTKCFRNENEKYYRKKIAQCAILISHSLNNRNTISNAYFQNISVVMELVYADTVYKLFQYKM